MSTPGALRHEDMLWLLGSLSGLLRLPFDAALVAQDFPPPTSRATLHEAARALGFRTGACRLAGLDWRRLHFPAIAFLKTPVAETPSPSPEPPSPRRTPGSSKAEEEPPAPATPPTPLLLLKSDGRQLLAFRAGAQAPETLPLDDLAPRLHPELILVARDRAATGEAEAIPGFETEK